MPAIVNISSYRFADLTELPELRVELREFCKSLNLKGTILLTPEGINLFIAGSRAGIDALMSRLREIPGLADLTAKESLSETQPFNRMLVKLKREIIAFGVEGIEPARYTSKRISAGELKQWLDSGKPVTLLDTRNNFEIDAGTFENAVAIGVDDFRDFPAAVDQLPEEMKQQPVVTFCTGGIRCEKAAPFMEQEGFSDVYQLDGGILKYFEVCGSDHYDGDCFVFDQRVSVDPKLAESAWQQCYVCQSILSVEDQASPKYVVGESCPHCYRTEAEQLERRIAESQHVLAEATTPLPGSVPYDHERPIKVSEKFDGLEILEFLNSMRIPLSRVEWREVCETGRIVCCEEEVKPGYTVRTGQRLIHKTPADVEPDVNADIEILYEDDAIVVINKPAPLPMQPGGRFFRNTLSYILSQVYRSYYLRPAFQLDADATGVVVFSKTRKVIRSLNPQFESGTASKTVLARVQGIVANDGEQFRIVHQFNDDTTLLEIRGNVDEISFPTIGLHSSSIEFLHPETNKPCRFEAEDPEWSQVN